MRKGVKLEAAVPLLGGTGVKIPDTTDPRLNENIFGEKPVNRVASTNATLNAFCRM
jgi:hypothetical protein